MSSSVQEHNWPVPTTAGNTAPGASNNNNNNGNRRRRDDESRRAISFSPYIVVLDSEPPASVSDNEQFFEANEGGSVAASAAAASIDTNEFLDAREELSANDEDGMSMTELELLAMANALQNQKLTADSEPDPEPKRKGPRSRRSITFSPYIVVLGDGDTTEGSAAQSAQSVPQEIGVGVAAAAAGLAAGEPSVAESSHYYDAIAPPYVLLQLYCLFVYVYVSNRE